LQALDESDFGREGRGWDCTPRAKSDIYDCLVIKFAIGILWKHDVSRHVYVSINLYALNI